MALQQSVTSRLPWGVVGAAAGQNIYEGFQGIAGDANISEGRFIFYSTNIEERNRQVYKSTGTEVAGFCRRWLTRPTLDYLNPDSYNLTVREGANIHCLTKGDYFAVATTTAQPGFEVFASTTDGTLQCVAPTNTPPSGTAYTGWFVEAVDSEFTSPVAAGTLIKITKYLTSAPVAASEG